MASLNSPSFVFSIASSTTVVGARQEWESQENKPKKERECFLRGGGGVAFAAGAAGAAPAAAASAFLSTFGAFLRAHARAVYGHNTINTLT